MKKRAVITGGAGFIGSNLAARMIRDGWSLLLIDDLSRRGAAKNLRWLRTLGSFRFSRADVRDEAALGRAVRSFQPFSLCFHFASQVAVTVSIAEPRRDFEVNTLGSLNLLETVRTLDFQPVLIYASANKVYGALSQFRVVEGKTRYTCPELPLGVPETTRLDFHSPYGCSKGAADQYFIDYARVYGMRTIVFRQSCVYGCRQFGSEDQGWVAWFMTAAVFGVPITVYGDGRQVRDLLFIDDLLDAYMAAARRIDRTAGSVYNIGGGVRRTLSLLELLEYLEKKLRRPIPHSFSDMRRGDQKYFAADVRSAGRDFGWRPRVPLRTGLDIVLSWILKNRNEIKKVLQGKRS
ncbi:MAG: NAD-dependent epimerase/dehydratase family protein [bacterium]